jgi:hypothetical protein
MVESSERAVAEFLSAHQQHGVDLPLGQLLPAVVLHVASPLAVYVTPFNTDIDVQNVGKFFILF